MPRPFCSWLPRSGINRPPLPHFAAIFRFGEHFCSVERCFVPYGFPDRSPLYSKNEYFTEYLPFYSLFYAFSEYCVGDTLDFKFRILKGVTRLPPSRRIPPPGAYHGNVINIAPNPSLVQRSTEKPPQTAGHRPTAHRPHAVFITE